MPDPRPALESALSDRLRFCGHKLYHSSPHARGQTRILKLLSESGPMPQRRLQEALEIQAGSLSELLNKMESRGWIERERDSDDRRCVRLRITKAGEAAWAHRASHSDAPLSFSRLSDDELTALTYLLDKVIEGWKEEGSPEGGASQGA